MALTQRRSSASLERLEGLAGLQEDAGLEKPVTARKRAPKSVGPLDKLVADIDAALACAPSVRPSRGDISDQAVLFAVGNAFDVFTDPDRITEKSVRSARGVTPRG